ncbi:MAG TPA: DNA replication and repair protein RecF [Verrucomicrobiae bacterium]|nr:DNA replication and repair protein RecF [Verrucomicrobiae bacterium]
MITDLRLQRFRSYHDASFELNPGVNIIVGPNASGKTNLLEALLVLARGRSYRVKDPELVQFGKTWARIDAHNHAGTQRTIKITTKPEQKKTYELDGKSLKRLSLQQTLPAVLFEPNHLQLFAGGSERRRDYLDDLLEQTTPGYAAARRQYRRTLTQRNTLLKQGSNATAAKLFPWDLRLSQLGGVLVRARSELAGRINDNLPGLYKKLSATNTKVTIAYTNQWPVDSYESRFLKKLETGLTDDQQRGFTGHGPHREDLVMHFDGRPAQETASRGETRTAILGLKIIELQTIEGIRATTPLLLLDDVFSELDGRRRRALTEHLAPYQTFITTTDADTVVGHFTGSAHVIPLSSGN